MQKRIPLILDVLLLILMALMIRYQLISAHYHELAGIILCGLLLIHFALHGTWLGAQLRRFSQASLAVRLRLLLDLLLCALVIATGTSGILISRTLRLWTARPVPYGVTVTHHVLGFTLLAGSALHIVLCLPQVKKQLRSRTPR